MLGAAKIFGTSPRDTLYEMSYLNAMLYTKAMPMVGDGEKEGEEKFNEAIDANNPDNFKQFEEEEYVR